MTEEIQNSAMKEVATQENQVDEVNQAQAKQQAKAEAEERNWKAMRLKNEDLEKRLREKDQLFEKMIQNQMEQKAKVQTPDEFDSIGDDEFISKGKISKLVEAKAKKYAEDIVKQEVDAYAKKTYDASFQERLIRQYADFNQIFNPETLSLLEEREPELVKTIIDLKDPYKIALQSYKYIKAMGLDQKIPEVRREKEIDKAIEKSEKTIQSPAVYDKRPIAQAFQLTNAMKKDLYREMHQYASFASSVPELS
jgi:hypothetical protein